ncbi:MAG: carbohydrate ABC transporter permease, partial [Aeromicrobium sp.]
MTTATAPAPTPTKPVSSDRSRSENRLGQKLVAPAIILMLIVTAFPMLRAIWLSVYNYSLTAPDDRNFVGLGNYLTALTDTLFWQTTGITVFYMVVTVAIELVIGFAFAMVMHRLI